MRKIPDRKKIDALKRVLELSSRFGREGHSCAATFPDNAYTRMSLTELVELGFKVKDIGFCGNSSLDSISEFFQKYEVQDNKDLTLKLDWPHTEEYPIYFDKENLFRRR